VAEKAAGQNKQDKNNKKTNQKVFYLLVLKSLGDNE
jgi:hypothetical protein